jgi:opacity protein-like surface antigen
MKKIILLISTFLLMLNPVVANASGIAIGVSVSTNTLTTDAKEDIDTNGTIDETKMVQDTFAVGSIFAEYSAMGESVGLNLGVDYIPGEADIDKRSVTQSSLKDTSTTTTGTNSVEGTVSDHMTLYLQPGIMVSESTMVYGTIGWVSATVNAKTKSLSSTDINKDKDLDGSKVGVGIKHVLSNGMFLKADYSETDYDAVKYVTSNNTTGTIDLDNVAFAISLGKQF